MSPNYILKCCTCDTKAEERFDEQVLTHFACPVAGHGIVSLHLAKERVKAKSKVSFHNETLEQIQRTAVKEGSMTNTTGECTDNFPFYIVRED